MSDITIPPPSQAPVEIDRKYFFIARSQRSKSGKQSLFKKLTGGHAGDFFERTDKIGRSRKT